MAPTTASDALHAQLYQSIGELVVTTQWVESRYRELGWFIDDPDRTIWPPRILRKESMAQLIDAVTDMFVDFIGTSSFPNGDEFAKIARCVRSSLHQLRSYRNQVLHSAFVELKAGGDIVGYLHVDPKRSVDPDTGELVRALESISSERVRATLATFGDACFQLNLMYVQAIHWRGLDGGTRWRTR